MADDEIQTAIFQCGCICLGETADGMLRVKLDVPDFEIDPKGDVGQQLLDGVQSSIEAVEAEGVEPIKKLIRNGKLGKADD